jgi:small redox-active disulfide protein 1
MVVKLEVFTSPSCPYCPMAKEVAEEARGKFGDSIEIEYVDITKDRDRAISYGLMAVPAIAIDGEVKFVGAPSLEDLEASIKEEL